MATYTIAHVSTQRGWHGGEEQARLLCEGLRSRGHHNIVFAKHNGLFAQRMETDGFQVERLSGSGRGPRSIWQLRQAWRKLRPDIIHFHDSHALSGGGVAAMGLQIPARIVARRVDFPVRSAWRYRHLADRVVAVSSMVAQVCHTSGVPAEKIRVVHDGVDPRRAESGDRRRGRESLGLAEEDILLLTVATLTDHKGHTFLLQGLPEVRRQLASRKIVVALAGDGSLRESLELQAKQLGLDDMVRFLGYRQDVPDLLKAADLFVLPSHLEGMGSSLIDVMFARTPIVSTTAGGIPDVLGCHNEEPAVAKLVPPRNPATLASAIVEAIVNRDGLQPLIERAAVRAHRSFTAEHMVEGTLAVYEEMLQFKRHTTAHLRSA